MTEQRNAVKYILHKKNIQCKTLPSIVKGKKRDERYISKVIHRKIKIHEDLQKSWSEALGVDTEYFVDDTGRCKILSNYEIHELDSYLMRKECIEIEDELYNLEIVEQKPMGIYPKVERELRYHRFEKDVTKLQRIIRKDIFTVNDEVGSEEANLNALHNNLYFYKNFLKYRKLNPITSDEWECLFKAFAYLLDDAPEEKVKQNSPPLVYGLFVIIKKSRELKKLKNEKELKELVELFPNILDDYFEEYK